MRVSKLGYVGFETPDVDRLVDYYTTVLDFELVDKSAGGAFLTTGFDHHCVVITQGDAQGRACVGYEIWEPLPDAHRRLHETGYDVERRSDIGPGTPDALVLIEPDTGTPLHLFASQDHLAHNNYRLHWGPDRHGPGHTCSSINAISDATGMLHSRQRRHE